VIGFRHLTIVAGDPEAGQLSARRGWLAGWLWLDGCGAASA
jgi:hypothetical protein